MSKHKSRIIHFAVTLVFIGIGALVFVILTATKPKLERTQPPAPKPMVRVTKVKTRPQVVVIKGEGTVKPQREIQLVPQVNGKVIYVSRALVDGGRSCVGAFARSTGTSLESGGFSSRGESG